MIDNISAARLNLFWLAPTLSNDFYVEKGKIRENTKNINKTV